MSYAEELLCAIGNLLSILDNPGDKYIIASALLGDASLFEEDDEENAKEIIQCFRQNVCTLHEHLSELMDLMKKHNIDPEDEVTLREYEEREF